MTTLLSGCVAKNVPTAEMILPERAAVVLFVDGMHLPRLQEMSAAGELPNIEHHFQRKGVTVVNARDAVPSVTYANSVTLLTGCLPGRHGIPGNRWFNPEQGRWRDYGSVTTFRQVNDHFTTPTIHEWIDDGWTASSVFHTNRGADVEFNDAISNGIAWFIGDYADVDRRSGLNAWDVANRARRVGRWPTLQLYYFPGVDEIGHRHGSDAPEYAAALRNVDQAIGTVFAAHAENDLLDRTYFVLVSDHGCVTTPQTLDLAQWLRATRRLRVSDLRRQRVMRADVVCVPNAGRVVALHLRGAEGWRDPADATLLKRVLRGCDDEPSDLWDLAAVDLVCWLEADELWYGTETHGVQRWDDRHSSRAAAHRGSSWVDGISAEETVSGVLAAELCREIRDYLSNPRSGDVLVFAADAWGFEEYAGGHGGVTGAEMRIPLFFRGPDLPAGGRIDGGHIADVTPTVLDLLGVDAPVGAFDGESLAPRLRNAEDCGTGL